MISVIQQYTDTKGRLVEDEVEGLQESRVVGVLQGELTKYVLLNTLTYDKVILEEKYVLARTFEGEIENTRYLRGELDFLEHDKSSLPIYNEAYKVVDNRGIIILYCIEDKEENILGYKIVNEEGKIEERPYSYLADKYGVDGGIINAVIHLDSKTNKHYFGLRGNYLQTIVRSYIKPE